MSIEQLAIFVALFIGLCGLCYGAMQKVERTDAEAAYDTAIARAITAENTIARDLHLKNCVCQPSPELELHFDQALEQAEPTPTFRRVK